ncbi:hypothetical protein [Modicisalibacter luteus]|uniref:Uncharacterized protein n=1 Tax=Modicisalibacter luteus TaxID=453962 RepID=A0ABV7M499_9GAMM|nr:hypothetical protein [Halomonas lutea]GHA85495.1 hypothetical protein GCM10007159_03280 [Halomonas lutea]
MASQARIFAVEQLRKIERGSFFRLIAEVYVLELSLGDEMINAGRAISYEEGLGGEAWCGS